MLLKGIITVNPPRPEDFRKVHKLNTVVLELKCRDTAPYFIDLLQREHGPWLRLAPPMFGLHVTLVKGTEKFDLQRAKQLEGRELALEADISTLERTEWSGDRPGFWCINVNRKPVDQLRKQLAVKTDAYGLIPHVTVAREQEFFMQAKQMSNAEAYRMIYSMLAVIPRAQAYRGSNYPLIKDLEQLRSTPALVTRDNLLGLVARHIPIPRDREQAYPGFNTRWEHDLVQLFRREP